MTKEDIEKAAVDSCVFENSIFNPELIPLYEQGFKDGANWRISIVWHNAREEAPTVDMYGTGKFCLVQTNKGDIDYAEANYDPDERKYYFSAERETYTLSEIKYFAYVQDLILNLGD